ncbi:MAG: hypothetical protein ACXWBL_17285, partial [Usitatibacter sp.]
KSDTPRDRGELLAWTAMQMVWEDEAEQQRITQITKPDEVLEFIRTQIGERSSASMLGGMFGGMVWGMVASVALYRLYFRMQPAGALQ